jgi:hypothetical protein
LKVKSKINGRFIAFIGEQGGGFLGVKTGKTAGRSALKKR